MSIPAKKHCFGITHKLNRCKNQRNYFLFCRSHVWQPITLLSLLISSIADVSGVLNLLTQPSIKDLEQLTRQEHAIIQEKLEILLEKDGFSYERSQKIIEDYKIKIDELEKIIAEQAQSDKEAAEALKEFKMGNLAKAQELFERQLLDLNTHKATILYNLSNVYYAQLNFSLSLDALNEAAKLDSSDITYRDEIGKLLLILGRYKEAEQPIKYVLYRREKVLGKYHIDVALSLNELAELYRAQSKYDLAEPLYKRALEIKEKTLGPNHISIAIGLNNLAMLYKYQARYSLAEATCNRAIYIFSSLRELDHPEAAQSYNILGAIYDDQLFWQKAEQCYLKALAIRIKSQGENHHEVANIYNNLAVLCNAPQN